MLSRRWLITSYWLTQEEDLQQGDQVMVYIWKDHFPAGTYNKLKDKKYRPFQIMKHINNNAYVVGLQPEMCISSTFNVVQLFE